LGIEAPLDTQLGPSAPATLARDHRGRSVASQILDDGAALVSVLADYGFIWVVIALRKRRPLTLLGAGLLSWSTNKVIKRAVGRARPQARRQSLRVPVRAPTSSSFPSGHTLAAFCSAIALADSLPEGLFFCSFAAAVGASRIRLGDHHFSDVAAGAVIGVLAGLATRRICRHFSANR